MNYIKLFEELSKNDAATAGGKGASLGEMTQAGIPVPPGFVVLASAFDVFLAQTDIGVEIAAVLDTVNTAEMHTVEHAAEKIQSLVLNAHMPSEIANEIISAYEGLCHLESSSSPHEGRLGGVVEVPSHIASGTMTPSNSPSSGGGLIHPNAEQFFVAVRSSATAEDSASAAWAGQLDSFLNTTRETLLQNVQKCWASLFTPRAIFYGFEKGFYVSGPSPHEGRLGGVIESFDTDAGSTATSPNPSSRGGEKDILLQNISVAVVVQAMVQSEVSGIAFSVHPVTQDRNQLIIEAGYGLGEAIVSGQVTPDSYVVTKNPLEIIDKNISTQDRMLVRGVNGGNEWISCSPPQEGELAVRGSEEPSGSRREGVIDNFVVDANVTATSPQLRQGFVGQANPSSRGGGLTTPTQKLSDTQILELSRLILKIEKHYGFPCDIEWAWANDQFYITQSRPITTLQLGEKSVPKYEKFFSRDFCLASVQAWVRGESTNPKGWTELMQPYLPYILTERADDTVHFWYDVRGVEWIQGMLVDLARSDKAFLKKIEQGVQKSLAYIRPIYEQEKILNLDELKRFVQELEAGYPWFEAMWWYCQMDSSKLVGLDISDMQKVRELTDILCNASDTVIRKSLLDAYPTLGDLVGVVTVEEIMSGNIPDSAVLAQRDVGYFYGNGELLVGTQPDEVARKFQISFHSEHLQFNLQKISGVAAMKGVVRGFVRRVMGHKQIGDVRDGEILVTPMTIPDFMPAMQKAAAFITDEGGITSHAAITARELHKPAIVGTSIATQVLQDGDLIEVNGNHAAIIAKKLNKPCIVGTKIATHVLHDGDLVEVDANMGVVKILERAK